MSLLEKNTPKPKSILHLLSCIEPLCRWAHTQDGLLLCGGFGFGLEAEEVMRSCLELELEVWRPSHALHHRRYLHTSWPRQHGVTLLGGGGAEDADTAEVAGEDGGVEEAFGLAEPSRWQQIMLDLICFSNTRSL